METVRMQHQLRNGMEDMRMLADDPLWFQDITFSATG